MRLLLVILGTTTLVHPRTEFLKCTHRSNAYGAAWLARTELLARQPLSQDKNALEYASFHILTESIRLGATALKAADDSFWVNHVSGYEHNVKRREGAEAAEKNVNAMAQVLTNKLCIPRTRPPTSTLWGRDMKSCYQKILPVMGRFVVFSSTDFTYHGHPQPQTSPKDRLRRSIALYYFTNGRPAKECLDGDCAGNDHSTLFKKPINCKVCEEATCKRYDETAPYWVDA